MTSNKSPYAYLGLWRNPFGELTPHERAELAVVDTARWEALLSDPRCVIQFVGDCGFGKTTTLLALQSRLAGSQRVYFPEFGPRPALPRSRPLLVDEAQRMGWLRTQRLLRGDGPLVLATHVDLASRFEAAGFRVITESVECQKSPAIVADILNRRIDASRVQGCVPSYPQPVAPLDERCAQRILDRWGHNLRHVESHLYEELQVCVREKLPWPLSN